MAVSLSTSFSGDCCYTHQLQQIDIATAADQVKFAVYKYNHDTYNTRTKIFETSYYTNLSHATVYDIGSLIEAYMLEHGNAVEQFVLVATNATNSSDSAELVLLIVYCKQALTDTTAQDLIGNHFLTNRKTRLTYPTATESLPYFAGYGSPGGYIIYNYTITGIYLNEDGTTGTFSYNSYGRGGYGVGNFAVSPKYILNAAKSRMPSGATLVAFTFTYGNRTAKFYLSPLANCRTFYYKNAYNGKEYLNVPTERTQKVKTKSSTAQYIDTTEQYDIEHTRTYEEQTPPLTLEEAQRMEEFLTSPSIAIIHNNTLYEIIITDYTFEVSDNPGKENTVKFEWQFANSRKALKQADITRIFHDQFTEPYV